MPPIQSYNNQSVVALNESFIDHNMSLKGNQVSGEAGTEMLF